MPVALDLGGVGERIAERGPGRGAQQRLPACGQRHHARGERLGQALDLETLGAVGDVLGAVLAQGDRADVQADTSAQRQSSECLVVVQRVAQRVERHVEQQEETVGAIDLSPTMAHQQVARPAIVLGPQLRCACVAQLLDLRVLSTTSVKSSEQTVIEGTQATGDPSANRNLGAARR